MIFKFLVCIVYYAKKIVIFRIFYMKTTVEIHLPDSRSQLFCIIFYVLIKYDIDHNDIILYRILNFQ